jgi:hypothetical protein
MMHCLRALAPALALGLWPAIAGAQVVRGTVTDSMSRQPIPGAVVTLLDTRGQVVGRALAGQAGQFAMPIPASAARVRVVRIGWRPRERALPELTDGTATVNFSMAAIPTFLEAARVDAKQCPKRSDSQLALGLWEQARDGLLAMVVAREQNLGSMVLLDYERTFLGVDETEARFTVKRTASTRALNSYRAVRSASNFIRFGFAAMLADSVREYYAPDADVLIDPGFADGYCFRIVRGDRARPTQVGLGFASPDRRAGRVDIEGVLWVDTAAKAIREIDFKYLGIHDRVDELRPGGNISFTEMPNGVSVIQRWHLRMVGVRPDTVPALRGGTRVVNEFHTNVGGGELAHARWADGTTYDAELGRAKFTIRNSTGRPAAGLTVGLAETPFAGRVDSAGLFEVEDLLPGTYRLIVGEPRLKALRMDSMPTPVRVTAVRGTTQLVSATVPSVEEWTLERCGRQARVAVTDTTLVLGRLLDLAGKPVARASVKFEAARRSEAKAGPFAWEMVEDGGRTDPDGMLQLCTAKVHASARHVRISGRLPDGEPYSFELELEKGMLTVAPLMIPRVIRQ